MSTQGLRYSIVALVALLVAVVVTCAALIHAYGDMRFFW